MPETQISILDLQDDEKSRYNGSYARITKSVAKNKVFQRVVLCLSSQGSQRLIGLGKVHMCSSCQAIAYIGAREKNKQKKRRIGMKLCNGCDDVLRSQLGNELGGGALKKARKYVKNELQNAEDKVARKIKIIHKIRLFQPRDHTSAQLAALKCPT